MTIEKVIVDEKELEAVPAEVAPAEVVKELLEEQKAPEANSNKDAELAREEEVKAVPETQDKTKEPVKEEPKPAIERPEPLKT